MSLILFVIPYCSIFLCFPFPPIFTPCLFNFLIKSFQDPVRVALPASGRPHFAALLQLDFGYNNVDIYKASCESQYCTRQSRTAAGLSRLTCQPNNTQIGLKGIKAKRKLKYFYMYFRLFLNQRNFLRK